MAIVLGFDEYLQPSQELAKCLKLPFERVQIHYFPDGEAKITLPAELPEAIVVCRSLNQPNQKLVELIFLAETAKALGVKEIILVAPYLCYMRQDIAFHKGEAVSQKIIGKLLAQYFNGVMTVDPHLHRIRELDEAIPLDHAIALHATSAMTEFINRYFPDPVIVGPDEESRQWVAAIAEPCGWDYLTAIKRRLDDKKVRMTLEDYNFSNRDVVIVDDIASTGHTLQQAIELLQAQGPASISVMVTHALFVDGALECVKKTGVKNIWSSDSILHQSNAFSIIPLLAESIRRLVSTTATGI